MERTKLKAAAQATLVDYGDWADAAKDKRTFRLLATPETVLDLIAKIEALEARVASAEGEWMPIETAPKDGTPILLCGGADDNAIYAPDKEQALFHSPTRAAWISDDWLITIAEAGCVGVIYENPTHWRPLPEPPARAHFQSQGGEPHE